MLGGVSWPRVLAGPGAAAFAAGVAMLLLESSFWLAVVAGAAVYVLVIAVVERLAFPADARAFTAFLLRRELPA